MATKFSDFSVTVPSFSSGTQTLVGFNDGGSNIKFTMSALANALPYSAGTGLSLSTFQYSLDVASSGTLGGIAIGYTQTSQNYPVVLDASNQAYVNVPWTDNDTTYTLSNGSTDTITLTASPGGASGTVQLTGGAGINITPGAGTIDISTSITQGYTAITATLPLSSSSTTPPSTNISMTQSGAGTDGWLSSADWNTFNNKGNGTVTSVDISSTGGTITATGGPITGAGTLNVDLPNVVTGATALYPAAITYDDQGRVTNVISGGKLRDTGWSPFEIYGGEQTLASDFGSMVQAVASSTFECDRAKIFVGSATIPSGGPVARIDIWEGTLKNPAAAVYKGGGLSGALVVGVNEISIAKPESPSLAINFNAGLNYVILIRCSGTNLSLLGKQIPLSDSILGLGATLPITTTPPNQSLQTEITNSGYNEENPGGNYRICCHLYEA